MPKILIGNNNLENTGEYNNSVLFAPIDSKFLKNTPED